MFEDAKKLQDKLIKIGDKEPVQVAELLEMQQVLDEKILKEHESCSGCPLCVETYDCELIECSVEPRDWNLELKEKIELD